MTLARWMRGSHLPLLILLGPVLLAAGCATEAGPVSPTPGSDSATEIGAVSSAPEPELSTEAGSISPTLEPEAVAAEMKPTPTAGPSPAPQSPAEAPTAPAKADFHIAVTNVATELTAPRPEYDTSLLIEDLVKPHFLARTAEGELREIGGQPDLIVEQGGRLKLRLVEDGVESYVDLLALQSELLGEHPAHKIYRLMAMGIPLDGGLRLKLAEESGAEELFANVDFEYLRGKDAAGVVAEVFPDGTLLVIPFSLPKEWQSKDSRIASPSHLHLNPRALSVGTSDLAREYEREILTLPFDEQRYPVTPLARKQCDIYRESLNHSDYVNLMDSVGFRFTPQHVARDSAQDSDGAGAPFGARIQALLWGGSGAGAQYFGFESDWVADVLRQEQFTWLGECDTAGGIRSYQSNEDTEERYYLIARRSLEPDKKERYKILTLNHDGGAEEIYTAPGIILMALPLPYDGQAWLLSTEGWPSPEGDQPPDPRWQAVYMVNIARPGEYEKVQYPIAQFPKAPEAGLYGVSPRLSDDRNHLFNTLYGFKDEGGGIWVVDVSEEGFQADPANFARIVNWDHTLSWTLLRGPDAESSAMHVFMTGKEVADDFAMTANILRIREAGLESSIEGEERLLQMVGWNPVPFGWQQLSDTQYRVLVETHYNYESSLLPRAKGVYLVPVDIGE